MSRITIDLKKRAKEHIHYDLSRRPVAEDEDGPYCYQMSHMRFRDIVTGGRSTPRTVGVPRPYEFARKWNSDGSDTVAGARTIIIGRGVSTDETLKPGSPDSI